MTPFTVFAFMGVPISGVAIVWLAAGIHELSTRRVEKALKAQPDDKAQGAPKKAEVDPKAAAAELTEEERHLMDVIRRRRTRQRRVALRTAEAKIAIAAQAQAEATLRAGQERSRVARPHKAGVRRAAQIRASRGHHEAEAEAISAA